MLILALAIMQPVAAQSFKPDFDAGARAKVKGDDVTALRHWRPLAEQGNARAQYWLGEMYMLYCSSSRHLYWPEGGIQQVSDSSRLLFRLAAVPFPNSCLFFA